MWTWRSRTKVAELLGDIAKTVHIVESSTGKDAADHVAAGKALNELVDVTKEPPTPKLTRLSDVVPESVSWVWERWIPAGKLVTLDGDPGLGKSTLAVAIAAHVTTGTQWPDGTPCSRRGDAILMSAEDRLADTIRPRLDAASADVAHVHAFEGDQRRRV